MKRDCSRCGHLHRSKRVCGKKMHLAPPGECDGPWVERGFFCPCTGPVRVGVHRRRWPWVLLTLAVLAALTLWAAPSSGASVRALPCIGGPEAPMVDVPDTDLAGVFLERPQRIIPGDGVPVADTEHLIATGGLGGMSPITYDLGCDVNPGNWADTIGAKSDASLGGKFVAAGHSITALSDTIDRKAWDGTWIMTFLGDFTDRATDLIETRVVAPFAGLGLLVATIILLMRAREGNVPAVAAGVAWSLIVIIVGGAILYIGAARLSSAAQSGAGSLVSALYGNDEPSLGATERVTTAVHYNGWLRRTFGTESSATAKEYGPALLQTRRMTWDEYDRTNPALAKNDADREARLEARKELIEAKGKEFNRLAAEIKDRDPQAYQHLQNVRGSSGVAFVEMLFAFIAAAFRLAVDFLLIMCLVLLTFYALAWLILTPWLVTSPGQDLGKGLLDATGRAVGYVIAAAIGAWVFSIWTEISLTPGMSVLWSVVLLLIGTIILWTLIRPDRKMLSLATMGRKHGRSRSMRWLIQRAIVASATGYAAGKGFGHAAADEVRESDEDRAVRLAGIHGGEPGRYMPKPEEKPTPLKYVEPPKIEYPRDRASDLLPANLAMPTLPERPAVAPYAPPAEPVYQRGGAPSAAPPTPPPAGAEGESDVYQRPGARTVDSAERWWKP